MAKPAPFRLNRSALLMALISTAFAGEAGAIAARVDFTTGGVTVFSADGRERPLTRGVELDSGDTVRTTDGRAQLRFTDGSYVSLQPNTEFSIKEYRFDGKADGNERGFFALARGAMRTVTGLVGRTNRDRYRITTPTATVGIRGTGGVIEIQNDGSTLVRGTSGIWSLSNAVGSIDVPAGTSAKAPPKPDTPPEPVNVDPRADPVPVPPAPPVIAKGDEPLPPLAKPLATGSGYAAVTALGWSTSDSPTVQANGKVSAVFNSANQLTSMNFSDGQVFKLDPVAGVHAEGVNNDGIIAWGRWTGKVTGLVNTDGLLTLDKNYNANQGLHYIIGTPTPVLPTGSATYTFLGATNPTYTDGSASPGTFKGGSLQVNFSALTVGLNLNLGINSKDYTIGGSAAISGNTFSGLKDFSTGTLTVTGGPGACTGGSGCTARVDGFFAGPNAERAGLGYHIGDAGKDIVGAAAFKK